MNVLAFLNSAFRPLLMTAFLVGPGGFYLSASPQSAPNIDIKASLTNNKVSRGRNLQAYVAMSIPSGYHVNSNKPLEKFLIPTQLTVEAPEGIRVGRIAYPRAVLRKFKFSKSNVSVYEGRTTLRFNLAIPANVSGSKEVKLRLRYQSCNDEVCFPPQTKELSLWLNVE
jgi:thiol:disulfide interchange protein DsbD